MGKHGKTVPLPRTKMLNHFPLSVPYDKYRSTFHLYEATLRATRYLEQKGGSVPQLLKTKE